MPRLWMTLIFFLVMAQHTTAQTAKAGAPSLKLDETTQLELINARALWVDYKGRRALKLAPREGHEHDTDQEMAAVLTGTDFKDGVIEIDVSGARRQGYSTAEDTSGYKGMIGLSFRVQGKQAERFYIRPENARLDNQLFRNRSTQYESMPEFPWDCLRDEYPGVYESYVDLESGAWTKLRIEVSGSAARLYVNGASQPCLIVNDLRHGESHGAIGLWARVSTDAYFSNLRVEPAELPKVTEVINGHAETATYRGIQSIRLIPAPETAGKDEDMMALLDLPAFKDGTIELNVAGAPRPGMPPDSRGFIGLSFRTGEHGEWSEVFYLRPTNGRADDQIRRNHSAQYVSHPQFTWDRLRHEHPGVYESYVDLEPGAWTPIKIVVAGKTARLYVNGAAQPTLVVNDLKHGDGPGRIALWAHVETDAYFGPLTVTAR
ncbi:MAG TPA: hypothetical protein VH988_08585 [Thermoanaerobaculia bacterium]|nr:hypothetical protein [Thermoanaerobaculia bacterium]